MKISSSLLNPVGLQVKVKVLTFSWRAPWPSGAAGMSLPSPPSWHGDSSAHLLQGRRNLIGWLHRPPGSPVGYRRTDKTDRKEGGHVALMNPRGSNQEGTDRQAESDERSS